MILRRNSIALLYIVLGLLTVANQIAFSNLDFPLIGASGEKIFGAGTLNRMQFLPDGRLITGGSLGVLTWDSQNGELLDWIVRYPNHKEPILDFAVSLDGQLILTGSRDGKARVWDRTGEPVTVLLTLPFEVIAVGFSYDTGTLFTANDGGIQTWNRAYGGFSRSTGLGIKMRWARFSPKGNLAIAVVTVAKDPLGGFFGDASDPQAAFLLNPESGQIKQTAMIPPQEYIANAEFSHDGTLLAITDQKGNVKIWNVASETIVAEITNNALYGLDMEFSPDGSLLATAGRNQPVEIWDIESRMLVHSLPYDASVIDLAFSPNGDRLAIGGHTDIGIWDIAREIRLVTIDFFAQSGNGLLSPGGNRIAQSNNGITIWNTDTGQIVARNEQIPLETVADFSSDSRRILTYRGKEWSVWDTDTLQLIRNVSIDTAQTGSFYTAQFSPDDSRIVSIYATSLSVWNTSTGEKIHDFSLPDGLTPDQASFTSSSHEIIILASRFDGVVQESLWLGNIDTGALTLQCSITLQPNIHYANPLVFSPDFGIFIRPATHPADSQLSFREVRILAMFNSITGNLTRTLVERSNAILTTAFSPDGQEIAEGGIDQSIHIWDRSNSVERKVMHGHTDSVHRLQFSADGSLLLSGSFDGTVRLWDTTSRSLTPVLNWFTH